MENYYVRHAGRLYGVLSADRIRECVKKNLFSEDDAVSTDSRDWQPLRSVLSQGATLPRRHDAREARREPATETDAATGSSVFLSVPVAAPDRGGRNRTVYMILSLTAGWLGANDFYAGRESRGFVKLLVSLFGLFALGLGFAIHLMTSAQTVAAIVMTVGAGCMLAAAGVSVADAVRARGRDFTA